MKSRVCVPFVSEAVTSSSRHFSVANSLTFSTILSGLQHMATLPHTAAASRGAGPFTVHPKVEYVCDRVSQVFVFQQTLRRSHSHTIQIQSGKSLLVPTNEAAAAADPPNRIFVEKGLLSTFLIDSFIQTSVTPKIFSLSLLSLHLSQPLRL